MTSEELQQLSDRELLVDTNSKVANIEGVLSRLVPQVNGLEEKQEEFVTKGAIRIMIGIVAGIFIPVIAIITKLLGAW